MTMGQLPSMKMKIALVAKTAGGNTIETSIEGGMLAGAGKMVMQIQLGPGPDAPAKKIKLRLDSEVAATADLGGGRRAIVPGEPDKSELVKRVTHCRLEAHPRFFDFFVEGCQFGPFDSSPALQGSPL